MSRPMPPKGLGLFNEDDDYPISFAPAPDVAEWLFPTIIDADGELHNEDHEHLIDADLAVLWAAGGFTKRGRTVVGQAEQVTFRCGPWQKGRQEQQMTQWFGRVTSMQLSPDAFVRYMASHLGNSDASYSIPILRNHRPTRD